MPKLCAILIVQLISALLNPYGLISTTSVLTIQVLKRLILLSYTYKCDKGIQYNIILQQEKRA